MLPDIERLKQLLNRLRDLEAQLAQPHEQAILEVGRSAVREEVSRLARSLRDHSYWVEATDSRRAG